MKPNTFTVRPEYETNIVEKKIEKLKTTTRKPQTTSKVTTTTEATTIRTTTTELTTKDGALENADDFSTFGNSQKNVIFVNSNDINLENRLAESNDINLENKLAESTTQKTPDSVENPSPSTTYPKNFAYHRVTGK